MLTDVPSLPWLMPGCFAILTGEGPERSLKGGKREREGCREKRLTAAASIFVTARAIWSTSWGA